MFRKIKNLLKKIPFLYWFYIHTLSFFSSFKDYSKAIVSYHYFKKDFIRFAELEKRGFILAWNDIFPCLKDKSNELDFEPHYTYHPAWAARILSKIKPEKHVDISSVSSFALLVSAFIPVEYYEYRPLPVKLSGLECKKADMLELPFSDNSICSLSCMHVLEHIGLGRYGDRLDSDADSAAARELSRVIAHGGHLLLVVPLSDPPKICFNAHRMYSYTQIINMFSDFKLQEFSLVRDKEYIENAEEKDTLNCNFACGCFYFRRK